MTQPTQVQTNTLENSTEIQARMSELLFKAMELLPFILRHYDVKGPIGPDVFIKFSRPIITETNSIEGINSGKLADMFQQFIEIKEEIFRGICQILNTNVPAARLIFFGNTPIAEAERGHNLREAFPYAAETAIENLNWIFTQDIKKFQETYRKIRQGELVIREHKYA